LKKKKKGPRGVYEEGDSEPSILFCSKTFQSQKLAGGTKTRKK